MVFDCRDPNALGRWWAAFTGGEVTIDEDNAWTVVRTTGPIGMLAFQKVPEGKVVKNRLHLDLYTSDVDGTVARAQAEGAKHLWDSTDPEDVFVTMADPEGNEFCVCLLED